MMLKTGHGNRLGAAATAVILATLTGCDRDPQTAPQAAAAATAPAATAASIAQEADSCSQKHDQLLLHSRGSTFTLGNFSVSLSGSGAPTGVSAVGSRKVHVWQEMSEEEALRLAPQSIAVRKAYLERPDGSFQFICDIDPNLNMDNMRELAAAVSVELP